MDAALRANYEVTRQLGEGGIGRVYEAVHRPSGRVVAIKTLRTEHGASSSQRLLLNEAAAAAQLAHPSIVELLDVGRDDRGGIFLVMELVRGSSLESWLGSFPGLATALRAFEEILAALSIAHAQGIVHGDLKPGNVLLTQDGRVKLTDFGIAHVIDPLKHVERRGLQGTPYYMAPEQLLDVASIGPSTDLYAIGVMLYELVAGREPYSCEGSLADLVSRKLGPVAPLEPRADRAFPPALGELVMSLLDPNPRTRPRFAARVRGTIAEIAKHCSDARASAVLRHDTATLIDPSIGSDPTIAGAVTPIVISAGVPMSGESSRSLPFSLPCAEGVTPDVALHRLRPLPLVGRSAQTQRLLADAAEIAAVGGARGVIVSGRAGEGKTRLVRHGFAEVERTGSMLGVAASFDETIANAEVGLRACMTRLLGAPTGTLAETLEGPWRWVARVAQPAVDFARIYEWLAPGARALDPAASADVASMCVLAASRVFPVYLWLDDVGWSRDGAMELFVRLLERDDARVLVLGTLRSGTAEHPAVRAWLLRAAKAGARLEMLPALDASDRTALVEAAGPVAARDAEALGGELDQPPLVLVEAVRAWIDEGDLVPSDRGYVLRDHARAGELAARAAGTVIARRIDKLLDGFGVYRRDAERVLSHAALLGLRFEERVLRACDGAAPWVDGVLDRALLTGLLRVDGRGAYRFEHRVFLDAIVERCARRPDAKAIRCATADALTAMYPHRALEIGLVVASLYRAGGRHEAAARRLGDTIRAFARASLLEDADRAIAMFAEWNDADALPEVHLRRALLTCARGHRAYFALDYDGAREHLLAAKPIFETLGATTDLNMLTFDLSSTYFYQDRFGDAERCLGSIAESGGGAGGLTRARIHHRLTELASMRGDLASAIAHEERALELAGENELRFTFIALLTLADLYITTGQLGPARAVAERASAMIPDLADQFFASDIEHTFGALEVASGYFTAARGRASARAEALRARDDRWNLTAARAMLLLCAAALDESPEDVERSVRELVDAYREVPHDEPFTWWMLRRAASHLERRGYVPLAQEVSAMLDARFTKIARAFKEDAAAR